jgi:hypothetical protein
LKIGKWQSPVNVAPSVKERLHQLLPWLFALVVALSRWPGLLPPNFSMVYALMFCAGVFFPGRRGLALPFGALLVTDLALNGYYQFARGVDVFTWGGVGYLACNYAGYFGLFWLGRRFRPQSPLLGLLGGGLLGALLFYLITNTAAWLLNPFHNPEYTKTLAGWIIALTKGVGGYPETWEFFRNTLLSGGLFTALFGAAWQATAAESPQEKGESAPEADGEPEPEEAKA